MTLKIEDKIAILIIHRENLQQAKTFENYRNAHVAYVDFLIEEMTAVKDTREACIKFANYGIKPNEENN